MLARADLTRFSLTPRRFRRSAFSSAKPQSLSNQGGIAAGGLGRQLRGRGNLTQYISHLWRQGAGDNPEDTRLIVTIARKGYQFTMDVTVAEAADAAIRPRSLKVLDRRKSHWPIPKLSSGVPADEAAPNAPKHWRNVAAMGASAVL